MIGINLDCSHNLLVTGSKKDLKITVKTKPSCSTSINCDDETKNRFIPCKHCTATLKVLKRYVWLGFIIASEQLNFSGRRLRLSKVIYLKKVIHVATDKALCVRDMAQCKQTFPTERGCYMFLE